MQPVSPTSMDASCLAHRWADLRYHSEVIFETSLPVCKGACLQQQLVLSVPTAVRACSRSFVWLLA